MIRLIASPLPIRGGWHTATNCALARAGRVESRDYADTAAMLRRHSPAKLIGFARRLDLCLGVRELAEAGRHLDETDDEVSSR